MKHKLTYIITLLFASLSAQADWFVQPKVGLEIKNFEYDYGDGIAKATIPSTVVGISFLNSNGYYFDFEFSSGTDEVSGFFAEDDYIERFDVVLSGGYSLGNGLVIFGGINSTDSQWENQKGQAGEPDDFQITAVGPFLGLSKAFAINKNNSLSVSVAAGLMEGGYESYDLQMDAGGDSFGVSGSAAYSYRSTAMSLSTGVKYQSYSYKDMGNDFPFENDSDFIAANDTVDTLLTYFAKIAYRF